MKIYRGNFEENSETQCLRGETPLCGVGQTPHLRGIGQTLSRGQTPRRGVGLGNFDGIHLGHAALFRKLIKECSERGLPACVYTFENHPGNIIFKDRHTPLIMTEESKIRILEETGMDELYLEHFDEEYAKTPPEEFVKKILVDKLHASLVVVGYDYTYGERGRGTAEELVKYGEKYGFSVFIIPPVKGFLPETGDKITVSSTFLRKLIQEGKMRDFRALTGRYYTVPGRVAEGRRVGATLGFPTANILPKDGFAIPEFGVYATSTKVDGHTYRSITNVGNNPTFADIKNITIETHIIGFNGELYGHDIEVEFIDKMRGEIVFPSPEQLIKQLEYDLKVRKNMCDGIIRIYGNGGVEIYYAPTDKFKSTVLKVMLCDTLDRERAYKNALIPAILNVGMRKYPEIADISERLQELYGADLSVGCSSVGETQYAEFLAEYTSQKYAPDYPELENDIIDFIFDMITDPVTEKYGDAEGFSRKIFERERNNRDDQIRSLINDKHAYAQKRCLEIMCEGEPYAVNNLGDAGDGDSLTPDGLYEYYRNEYLNKVNVRIFYAGKEYPQHLTERVLECFSKGERVKLTKAYKEKFVPENDVRFAEDKMSVSQGKLFLGYRTNIPPESEEYYASALCAAILGQGPNSKLFINVREKNSLAYYAAAYVIKQKGILLSFCGIDPENKDEALKLMTEQLEAIKRGEISKEEYDAAVKTLKTELMSYNDNPALLLTYYFGQTFMDNITDPEVYAEHISKVTIDDIASAAGRMTLDTVYFLTGNGEVTDDEE